ncbi:MAG: helix-turn-helix transcriptional regulator [Ruminococcaceae bacterium]|nr:helix-turn-helix transcriptional regulator [Oscillospiraceae bacterium]
MEIFLPELIEHTSSVKNKFWLEEVESTNFWQLIIIENGSFTFEMAGKTETAEAYSAVVFPKDINFKRNITDEILLHNLSLSFEEDSIFLKRQGQYLIGKLPVDTELIKSTCEILNRFMGKEYLKIKDMAIKTLWTHALIPLLDNKFDSIPITNETVRLATEYIHDNIQNNLSVEFVARKFGFTALKFNRLFSKETGTPPSVYINRARLNKGARLLLETDLSINEISAACGFENQFYFHNRFKKFYGISPSGYRKRERAEN